MVFTALLHNVFQEWTILYFRAHALAGWRPSHTNHLPSQDALVEAEACCWQQVSTVTCVIGSHGDPRLYIYSPVRPPFFLLNLRLDDRRVWFFKVGVHLFHHHHHHHHPEVTLHSLVMVAGSLYIATAWTTQKTPLSLLRVLSFPEKRVPRAVP
jgi:hypothetical protein